MLERDGDAHDSAPMPEKFKVRLGGGWRPHPPEILT